MCGQRRGNGSRSGWQRPALAVGFCLISGWLAGCGHRSAAPADEVYRNTWLQVERGDLHGALRQTDSELRRFPDTNGEWHCRFTVLKGEILVRQGLDAEAVAFLRPELPPAFASTDIAVRREVALGAAYGFLNQFERSQQLLSQAENLARRVAPQLLGEVALRQGTLAFLRGDSAAAESAYRTTLEIAREQHDRFLEASALGSLGLIATRQEHYDESIDWDQQALELSQAVGAQTSVARILGNMGWSYFSMGDFENALALYQQAEKASAESGLVRDRIYWLIDVGNAYYQLNDDLSSEQSYHAALVLAQRLDDQAAVTECYENLAVLKLERREFDAARQDADEISKALQGRPDPFLAPYSMLVDGWIAAGQGDIPGAEKSFLAVVKDPDAETSLRWEAHARLAMLYEGSGRLADAEREFQTASDTLEAARSSIHKEELRISFLANATELYDDYVDFLVSQHQVERALGIAVQTRARTLLEGLGLDPQKQSALIIAAVNWNEVARRNQAVILCYWLGSRHSYLWAIAPSGQFQLFPLPAKDQIERAVRAYGDVLLGPRDPLETQNTTGMSLSRMLVAPARSLIPPGSRVIIVPDGDLCGLNFATLLVAGPLLHYWIDDVTVSYSDSLLLLAAGHSGQAAPVGGRLLLIGDPVSPSDEFPPLPQASAEMASIEKYFRSRDKKVLSGAQATPASYLRSRPDQFSFIHFAAHAASSRTRPLESAVILSREGDSFKLYGRDVVNHPLKAKLVTISACHGAGSRNYSSEGLVGLSWAFLRAGAGGVIAALWDVNDRSTADLMDHLYAELSKGKDPASALRDAQLQLLHSGTIYRRPFYWAPFQFYLGL
jgi:CHAT domain-containing protein/Flp pilus assembly protein TadD